jgi:hypothetical protein
MSEPQSTNRSVPFWKKWLAPTKPSGGSGRTSASCDVCNRDCGPDRASLLTTAEVASTTTYWTDRMWPRFAHLPENATCASPRALAFLKLVRQLTSNNAPWLVCDDCVSAFAVDRGRVREYAARWFKRTSFTPLRSGAVPMSVANIGDLTAFGPNVAALAAACVVAGLRGNVARGSGRRTHFKALSDARVLGKEDRLDDIWPILLREGQCLLEIDLAAFHATTLVLWVAARAVLDVESLAPPRLVPVLSAGAIGESCFLLERILRLELACRGCKQSPSKRLDPDQAIAAGRCEWCKSTKAYLLVAYP